MEIPCSWPLHIRSSTANELRLTHRKRSRTLLRRPSGGSYAPGVTEEILHIVEIEDGYIRNDGRQIYTYIYKRKISIEITCVGLASARPNKQTFVHSYTSGFFRVRRPPTKIIV